MPASSTGSATALPGNHSSAEDSRLDWQAGVSYPSSSTLKHYYANGRRIATRDSEGLKFYHLDHLGSTSRVTNQGGAQVRVIRYDPWGYSQAAWGSGTALVKYTYTGKELDAGTGLMYYGARYYDPALGMFLSPDTVVPEPGEGHPPWPGRQGRRISHESMNHAAGHSCIRVLFVDGHHNTTRKGTGDRCAHVFTCSRIFDRTRTLCYSVVKIRCGADGDK